MICTLTIAFDAIYDDVMGQNQSHVARNERAEISHFILSENVKVVNFFVFTKNQVHLLMKNV